MLFLSQSRVPPTLSETMPTWRLTVMLPEMSRWSALPFCEGGWLCNAAGTLPVLVIDCVELTLRLVFAPSGFDQVSVAVFRSSSTAVADCTLFCRKL